MASSSVHLSSHSSSVIPCLTSLTSCSASLLKCWANRSVTAAIRRQPNPCELVSSTPTFTYYAISLILVESSSCSPTYVALSSTSRAPITMPNTAAACPWFPAPYPTQYVTTSLFKRKLTGNGSPTYLPKTN